MANWCTGDLKVRGEYKNIKKFLLEEMVLIEGNEDEFEYVTPIIDESDGIKINVGKYGMWFKNAYKSCFSNNIDVFIDDKLRKNNDILTLNLGELQAAWEIETDLLIELSEQYKLDFKIYAYEKLMQFNIDFEVQKGEVIKNNKIKFNDYIWECTNPEIGGE